MGATNAENDDVAQEPFPSDPGEPTPSPPLSSVFSAIEISSTYPSTAERKQRAANQEDIGQKEWLSSSSNFDGNVDHLCADPVTGIPSVQNSREGSISEDQDSFPSAASKPIAIDLPTRKRQFHTPLSARGDLIGGYFPFHEASQRSLETHPFNKPSSKDYHDYHAEMFTDSPPSTPAVPEPSQHNSPYNPHYLNSPSPTEPNIMGNEVPSTPPLVCMPPLGKYHPANYRNKTTPSISLRSPRSQPSSSSSSNPVSPQLERAKTDIKNNKQLLRKYQRDMVEQATRAARRAGATIDDPGAPKLTPLGSPGPVTPMELEESHAAGYLIAGAPRGSSYRQGENSRKESDMVGRMIRGEEERRRREGQSSPLATAGGH